MVSPVTASSPSYPSYSPEAAIALPPYITEIRIANNETSFGNEHSDNFQYQQFTNGKWYLRNDRTNISVLLLNIQYWVLAQYKNPGRDSKMFAASNYKRVLSIACCEHYEIIHSHSPATFSIYLPITGILWYRWYRSYLCKKAIFYFKIPNTLQDSPWFSLSAPEPIIPF